LLALAVAVGPTNRADYSPTLAPVWVDMALSTRPTGYVLEVTLRSHEARPVVLNGTDLPWGGKSSLVLMAIAPDTGASLQEARGTTTSQVAPKVTLKVGERLRGQINLSARFPKLEETLKVSSVIVFWAYRARLLQPDAATSWQAGSVVIPKGGPELAGLAG
jgi:hypothetical protein